MRPPKKNRRTIIAVVAALALITGFGAIMSTWVRRQALNSGSWPNTSSKLLADEKIQNALGAYLVGELFTKVDVAGELRSALPPEGQALAAPAAGGLRSVADRLAPELLARPRVQDGWRSANEVAHAQLLKVLNGGGENISTANGEVTLNLNNLVDQLASTVGLGSAADKIPQDAGQLTIMKADQLKTAQDVAQGVRHLSVALTLISFALFALAVYLARGWRRLALRRVGWSLVGLGVFSLLVRRVAGNQVVDGLVNAESVKPAVHEAWNISTSLLYTIAVTFIVYGLLIVTCAWLAGPSRSGVATRRALAPSLRDHPGRVYGVAATVYLLVLLWGPTPAFRKLLPIVLIAGLVVLGIEMLRRQTAREFPDVQAGEATRSLREWWGTHFSRRHEAPVSPTNGEGHVAALERLAKLRDRGVITDAEFSSEKAALIGAP
jgi:Short C-terminal domain